MKLLILYYSYSGNTRSIAEEIQKKAGGTLAEIKTVMPYAGDYNVVVDQGQREVERGYEPEICPLDVDLSDFDTIILGTPVWWYTFAPAVKTLLSHSDWKGKRIYPFATNGGWLGHTLKDIKTACVGAAVEEGLDIRFDGIKLKTDHARIDAWVQKIVEDNENGTKAGGNLLAQRKNAPVWEKKINLGQCR